MIYYRERTQSQGREGRGVWGTGPGGPVAPLPKARCWRSHPGRIEFLPPQAVTARADRRSPVGTGQSECLLGAGHKGTSCVTRAKLWDQESAIVNHVACTQSWGNVSPSYQRGRDGEPTPPNLGFKCQPRARLLNWFPNFEIAKESSLCSAGTSVLSR